MSCMEDMEKLSLRVNITSRNVYRNPLNPDPNPRGHLGQHSILTRLPFPSRTAHAGPADQPNNRSPHPTLLTPPPPTPSTPRVIEMRVPYVSFPFYLQHLPYSPHSLRRPTSRSPPLRDNLGQWPHLRPTDVTAHSRAHPRSSCAPNPSTTL